TGTLLELLGYDLSNEARKYKDSYLDSPSRDLYSLSNRLCIVGDNLLCKSSKLCPWGILIPSIIIKVFKYYSIAKP
ncbi:hypothetical protein ACOL23_12940, partial [Aliarcobacter butzleri]